MSARGVRARRLSGIRDSRALRARAFDIWVRKHHVFILFSSLGGMKHVLEPCHQYPSRMISKSQLLSPFQLITSLEVPDYNHSNQKLFY